MHFYVLLGAEMYLPHRLIFAPPGLIISLLNQQICTDGICEEIVQIVGAHTDHPSPGLRDSPPAPLGLSELGFLKRISIQLLNRVSDEFRDFFFSSEVH